MYIRDHELLALDVLNGLNLNKAGKVAHVLGPNKAVEAAMWFENNKMQTIWDILDLSLDIGITMESAENLAHWALDVVEDQHHQSLEWKQRKLLTKTMNRTRYLKEQVFIYYETKEGDRRWRFDSELRSSGLLTLVSNEVNGEKSEPVSIQILNQLPQTNQERDEIPSEALDKLLENKIAVSGGRLGWNMNHPAWEILKRTFPNAVNLAAYGHSLNAPVLPLGYFPDIKVRFARLSIGDKDLGTDGSGLYNADHPMFTNFIMKYGACPFQIRGLNPETGLFIKGAVRPVNMGPDAPPFVLDWNQIKGHQKANALQDRDDNRSADHEGIYIGIIQTWNRRGSKLKACFEMLENIQVNAETVEIVKELVDEELDNMVQGGMDQLLASVSQNDDNIAKVVQLVHKFKTEGGELEATQIPMVRNAINKKLQRRLYRIAQGAGVKFRQRVCFLDNTVEQGTIVAWGYKPGTTVTSFRFPLILAQGLRVLEVVEPSSHQLVNGKLPINTVFMNPKDLTDCMQGDDDGDIVGLSDDPRMARLFQHVIDTNIYHIEPSGKKVHLDVESREGLLFIRVDQRGPVGTATNLRSDLLALGPRFIGAANAMSIMIQESVDKAKRIIEWSDFKHAADLKNWEKVGVNEYKFTKRLETVTEEELQDNMQEWVSELIISAGHVSYGPKGEKAHYVSPWRWKGKKIDPSEWVPTKSRSKFTGGNLVHLCHDYAYERWQFVKDLFKLDNDEVELRELLPKILNACGVKYKILHSDWASYNTTLRRSSGIASWGKTYQRINASEAEDESRHAQIDLALLALRNKLNKLTTSEIVTIWYMELSPERNTPESGINNAFRAISTVGNPVLHHLGIGEGQSCEFMSHVPVRSKLPKETRDLYPGRRISRLQVATAYFMRKPDPQSSMVNALFDDLKHADAVSDANGQPIHMWDCPVCVSKLTDSVVGAIRADKSSGEVTWAKTLHAKLK